MTNDDREISYRRGMLTNGMVFIIGFFTMILHMCYQRMCDDQEVGLSDCKYVHFGGDMADTVGVPVVWYTCLYTLLTAVSIIGLFNVCCSRLGCTKIYAVGIATIFFCITVCDFITMAAVGTVHKGSQNLREFYVFQVLIFWLLQLGIISTAAYDSFNQNKGKTVYMKDTSVIVMA